MQEKCYVSKKEIIMYSLDFLSKDMVLVILICQFENDPKHTGLKPKGLHLTQFISF